MLWSIGKVRGIYAVSPGKETEGYGEKDWQKRKVLSLEWKSEGVMNDESGESMEPIEEVLPPSLSTAASVLAMISYDPVSASLCHKSVFCQNVWVRSSWFLA